MVRKWFANGTQMACKCLSVNVNVNGGTTFSIVVYPSGQSNNRKINYLISAKDRDVDK